jgi:membrane associated rhomboid family serine protease
VVTLALTVLTGLTGAAGLLDATLRDALRRDPTALAGGAWWRLATPLLVRTDGWLPLLVVLAGTVAAGSVVERRLGRPALLALFLGGGLAGQAAGYLWDPTGAGSSVAVFGLFGGVWGLLLRSPERLPVGVRAVGAAGLCVVAALATADVLPGAVTAAVVATVLGAVTFNLLPRVRAALAGRTIALAAFAGGVLLTALRDNHGPAILAGAAVFAALAALEVDRPAGAAA